MKILVINAWSSSLKYQLFDMKKKSVVVKWIIEKVWIKNSSVKNHKDALHSVMKVLSEAWNLAIDAIGHRVVHWGEYFKDPAIITDEVLVRIDECSDLAPLHNPHNLQAILACKDLFPGIPQVAVFDTAFHQTMEPAHYLYALPTKYYEQYKIRRYGFHWTSHQYVYNKLIANYQLPISTTKVITCHVGNGVSVAAITNGKVVETSMGMTPLEWTMMGTRSGNIDPAIIPYLMTHESMTPDEINDLLNTQSGLLGVSWVSSDMRDLFAEIEKWNKQCSLALEMFITSLAKYIWAYACLLWWVDAIVLTAGVMEHRAILRAMLLEKLSWMGILLNKKTNQDDLESDAVISLPDSKIMVVLIPTNEELMIAEQTYTLIYNL